MGIGDTPQQAKAWRVYCRALLATFLFAVIVPLTFKKQERQL